MQKPNIQNTVLRLSAGNPSQFPREAIPQIVFAGRSNVGKSSLINTLLGRKSLARVSSAPGKTITVNFYDVDRKLYFVDLPGYGYAKRSFADKERWSVLTDAYFTANKSADMLRLTVLLIDSRTGATADDVTMADYIRRSGLPFVIAATKTDKLNATEKRGSDEKIRASLGLSAADRVIPFSSETREGRDTLLSVIFDSAR